MPLQRGQTEQARLPWRDFSTDNGMGQYPRIDAMSAKGLCQFLLALLQPQGITEVFSFPALTSLDGGELAQFLIEPLLAHFQGGETLLPPPFALGGGFDVFHDEVGNRKESDEPATEPKLPLPAGFRGGRQLPG